MGKSVLVVGGNFSNKGAQSMLFVTTDEIKKINPDCVVYYGQNDIIHHDSRGKVYFSSKDEEYNEEIYTFKKLRYTIEIQNFVLAKHFPFGALILRYAKDFVKWVTGHGAMQGGYIKTCKVLPKLDMIIDISGYAIADFASKDEHEYYLNSIRIGKKYGIPVILMPQSFGPFDYPESKKSLMNEVEDVLRYPDIIFAREKSGYTLLKEKLGLSNVSLSADLVLQNKSVNKENVYKVCPVRQLPKINATHAVAVIPNYHCFEKGNEKNALSLYKKAIDTLVRNGRDVYVFRHSSLDLSICKMIAKMYQDDGRIHLIEREFDCVEFDEFVKQFEFIICSRFHGCVHAYKNDIPCIVFGWAVKYQELAEMVGQSEYVFDIVDRQVSTEKIECAVNRMLNNVDTEKTKISKAVEKVQAENCFMALKNYLS